MVTAAAAPLSAQDGHARPVLPEGKLSPEAIIRWALHWSVRPVVSTNFRPGTATLLHLITRQCPRIPVLWVDTGYNTEETYRYAEQLTRVLDLNLEVYTPRVSAARRRALEGGVPDLDDPRHAAFTAEVKLEPFQRALETLQPDVWFTGIRSEHNRHRQQLGVVSAGPRGTTRVAPLHRWTASEVHAYLVREGLPDYAGYLDPTKGEDHRECGLHRLGAAR